MLGRKKPSETGKGVSSWIKEFFTKLSVVLAAKAITIAAKAIILVFG